DSSSSLAAHRANARKALMRIAPPRTVARMDARAEPTGRYSRRSSEGRCAAGPHAGTETPRNFRGVDAWMDARGRATQEQLPRPLPPCRPKSRGAEAAPTEGKESRRGGRSYRTPRLVGG